MAHFYSQDKSQPRENSAVAASTVAAAAGDMANASRLSSFPALHLELAPLDTAACMCYLACFCSPLSGCIFVGRCSDLAIVFDALLSVEKPTVSPPNLSLPFTRTLYCSPLSFLSRFFLLG